MKCHSWRETFWELIRLDDCTAGTKKWYLRSITIVETLGLAYLAISTLWQGTLDKLWYIPIPMLFMFVAGTWMYQNAANEMWYRETHQEIKNC